MSAKVYRYYEDDHLLNLYLKWREDPNKYKDKMMEVVDKIVHTVIGRLKRRNLNYKEGETYFQWERDLRIAGYKCLHRIKAPYSNKRIYNFIRVTISFTVKDKDRALGKYMNRPSCVDISDLSATLKHSDDHSLIELFNDSLTHNIAELLLAGYTYRSICSQLDIKPSVLKKELNQIKQVLIND